MPGLEESLGPISVGVLPSSDGENCLKKDWRSVGE